MEPGSLLKMAIVILILSTLGYAIFIPILNSQVLKIENDKNDLIQMMDILEDNLQRHSEQLQKMSSTYPAYAILLELNSTYTDALKQNLRREMYQSIVILRQDQLSSEEISQYDELSFNEVESIVEEKWGNAVDKRNELSRQREPLNKKLIGRIRLRDHLLVFFAIFQTIGVTLVVVAEYLKEKSQE